MVHMERRFAGSARAALYAQTFRKLRRCSRCGRIERVEEIRQAPVGPVRVVRGLREVRASDGTAMKVSAPYSASRRIPLGRAGGLLIGRCTHCRPGSQDVRDGELRQRVDDQKRRTFKDKDIQWNEMLRRPCPACGHRLGHNAEQCSQCRWAVETEDERRRKVGLGLWVVRALRMRGWRLCALCGLLVYQHPWHQVCLLTFRWWYRRRHGRFPPKKEERALVLLASGRARGRAQRHAAKLARVPRRTLERAISPALSGSGRPRGRKPRKLDRDWSWLVAFRAGYGVLKRRLRRKGDVRAKRLTRRDALRTLLKPEPIPSSPAVRHGIQLVLGLMPGRGDLLLSTDRHGTRSRLLRSTDEQGKRHRGRLGRARRSEETGLRHEGLDQVVRLPDELIPLLRAGERDDLIRLLHAYEMRPEAIARLTGAFRDHVDALALPPSPAPIYSAPFQSVQDAVSAWVAAKARAAGFTRERGRWQITLRSLRAHLFPFRLPDGRTVGEIRVDELTRDMIVAVLRTRDAAGKRKHGRVRGHITWAVREFYRHATKGRDGKPLPNPAGALRSREEQSEGSRRRMLALSPEERRERAMLMVQLDLGPAAPIARSPEGGRLSDPRVAPRAVPRPRFPPRRAPGRPSQRLRASQSPRSGGGRYVGIPRAATFRGNRAGGAEGGAP